MACNPEVLQHVPLFASLNDEETAVLAGQVEVQTFRPRQRIYKMGDPPGAPTSWFPAAFASPPWTRTTGSGGRRAPHGEFFGFASMLEQTPHQTDAVAVEETVCLEVDREDISILLQRKPLAGMDMLAVLGRQFHAAQQLVRVRAMRNPNEMIEEKPPSASASPTRWPDSAARGHSSFRS